MSLDNVDVLIKSCNEFDIEYELVKNVTAHEAPALMNSYNIEADQFAVNHIRGYDRGISKYMLLPTAMGCFMSHYLLWIRCAKADETFLILEHDAVVIRDPRNLDFIEVLDLNPLNSDYKEQGPDISSVVPFKRECCYGSEAYFIKPSAARRAIALAEIRGWLPSDKFFNPNNFDNLQEATPNVVQLVRKSKADISLAGNLNLWKDVK